MDEKLSHGDIDLAEDIDAHLQTQTACIEDIRGSLEALTQAIVGEEPRPLTEHQQELVDGFRDATKNHQEAVIAVADKAALESVSDFFEATSALARKAVVAFSKEIPAQFKITAKGLNHYAAMAQRLRNQLTELRPLLVQRDFPYTDVFDFGAYSRFFQVAGESIHGASQFQEAMNVQNKATRHVMLAASSYGVPAMEKLLRNLQGLRAGGSADTQEWIKLRDSLEVNWEYVWNDSDITQRPGQTPQSALNEYPERKFVSLAPLLDNRYLLAHRPKSNGGSDPVKITAAIRHYGASLVFDKKTEKPTESCMDVPNVDDLLKMLDDTAAVLSDMRMFDEIAKKNNDFAKDFAKAADILNKQIESTTDAQFYGFVAEYFKLATAISQSIQQPYVQVAWMYIRCALVITALVEHAVLEDRSTSVVSKRFFAKQASELSNPALESFAFTQKALQAARRAKAA